MLLTDKCTNLARRAQATQSREVAALALSRLSQLRNTIQRDTVTSDHLHEDDYLDFSWQTQVVNPLSDTADRLDGTSRIRFGSLD